MQELEKLGKVMSVVMDKCDDCPLERICSSAVCYIEWKRFFESKVKEEGKSVDVAKYIAKKFGIRGEGNGQEDS